MLQRILENKSRKIMKQNMISFDRLKFKDLAQKNLTKPSQKEV